MPDRQGHGDQRRTDVHLDRAERPGVYEQASRVREARAQRDQEQPAEQDRYRPAFPRPLQPAPRDQGFPRQEEEDRHPACGMKHERPARRRGGEGKREPAGQERDSEKHEKRQVGPSAESQFPFGFTLPTAVSIASRNRAWSAWDRRRNASGGSKRRRTSACLTLRPLAVTVRMLIRRSVVCGFLTTSPFSSSLSVGSTTVEGLQCRRLASSFCEMACSGSSWTRTQADTGDRSAAAAASFMRSSQPAKDSTISAQSSWASEL